MAHLPTDDDLAVVQDCERALLTGAVRGDRTSAGLLVHQDFREVGASGRVWDRERILTLMEEEATAAPFRVEASDMVAVGLAPDVALVTYTSKMKGTFQGRKLPGLTYASALWVQRDGKWLEAFYQETPVAKK